MNITNPRYMTYRPDMLVKSTYSETYRLSAPEYTGELDSSPFTVTFRPAGRDKVCQISVKYGFMDLDNVRGQGITVLSQVVNHHTRQILEERIMYKGFTNYNNIKCPMCMENVIWNDATSRWACTSGICSFDYSQQSCAELEKIYTDAVRGLANPSLLGVLSKTKDNLQITKL